MGFFKRRRSPRVERLLDTEAVAIEATSSGMSGDGAKGQSGPSSSEASNRPKLSVNVSLSAWLRLVRLQSASRTKPSTQTPKSTTINSKQSSASISDNTEIHTTDPPEPVIHNRDSDTTLPLQPSGPASQTTPPKTPTLTTTQSASTMAERTLQQVITQLRGNPSYEQASPLLSKAKLSLLQLKALTPTPSTPSNLLAIAREVYELGAITSIRARNPDAFKRYVQQLQPFYELPSSQLKPNPEARNKVTGLYLLLLLTEGRYDIFHSELESLSMRVGNGGFESIEADRYLGYPIKLERWLMEGSYDRVWKAMKKGEVPSEEFGIFSQILTSQIRSEIASSSERAYPSLPLSSTKSLLFLDSEGAVVEFARQRGWVIREGQIYFPAADDEDAEEKDMSQMVIENTLGYARELETIV